MINNFTEYDFEELSIFLAAFLDTSMAQYLSYFQNVVSLFKFYNSLENHSLLFYNIFKYIFDL